MTDHCDHEHAGGLGLTGHALGHALADAEARCGSDGQRLTAPRRRVLELLLTAPGPVKAYDLIGTFGAGGVAAKPPTVYRALEFLEKQGFAHRIESLNVRIHRDAAESKNAVLVENRFSISSRTRNHILHNAPAARAQTQHERVTAGRVLLVQTTDAPHLVPPTIEQKVSTRHIRRHVGPANHVVAAHIPSKSCNFFYL